MLCLSRLIVTVKREGKIYQQEYRRGAPQYDVKVVGESEETGTTVHFKPDFEIFTETLIYEYEVLQNRIRELAFLNKGIEIVLLDERTGATNTYQIRGRYYRVC